MSQIAEVIILGVVIAVIATAVIFIVKNIAIPSKIENIPKMIKERKFQAAQKCAKMIIAKDPRNYIAHYWLGKSYLMDNKPELAFMEYKTVNENALFNGTIPEASFRKDMAKLYKKYDQNEDALKEFLLLTKLEPNKAEHNFNAAEIYELQGNAKLAMGFYQKTLMTDKKNSMAYTGIGRVYFRAKNYPQAKQALETAIKLSPDCHENYYYLGKVCKETKDLSGAVKLLEKAERSPDFKQKALIEKGTCLVLADQTDKAINAFEIAISNAKDMRAQETLYARYFLGVCYEKIRKIEKAIEQWEMIFKINSKFKDVSAKLSQYKEIETNDGIKEYLTSSNIQFLELCKKLALAGYKLQCQKAEATPYGCQMIATEDKSDNWMNVKQQVYLIQFYRSTKIIEESIVRKVADAVKSKNYKKGYIFASSDFSPAAISYAETRPVVLIPKDTLESLFKNAGVE